jgi:hypothetical protein
MKEPLLKEKPKSGYWYKFYTRECVLCGAFEEWKERQYTPKPIDPWDRYERIEYACGGHFL